MLINHSHPYHPLLDDPLVKITDHVPTWELPSRPSWSKQLTHEPVAR